MYREKIKVLDCTVRDGGLINNYHFKDDFVKAVYRATCDSGIDIMEIGKKLCVSEEYTREKYGKWNFCDEDDMKYIVDSYECEKPPSKRFPKERITLDGCSWWYLGRT